MYKILFVCLGNICRSPMAEFVMKDLLEKRGISTVYVESAATSSEEIGNPVHRGTLRVLNSLGIDCSKKRARKLAPKDYREYDLIIGMERSNLPAMLRCLGLRSDGGGKLRLLLDFTDRPRDIPDPWYTGDFDSTYRDVLEGCEGLLAQLEKEGKA